MPRGPKGEKWLADVIGNAVKVMKIAAGKEGEDTAAGLSKDLPKARHSKFELRHYCCATKRQKVWAAKTSAAVFPPR